MTSESRGCDPGPLAVDGNGQGGHHVIVVRDPEGIVMPSGSFKPMGFRFEVFGFQ